MEAATESAGGAPAEPLPTEEEDEEQESTSSEEEKLVVKAQELMDKITSSIDNPNPNVLHALASILETQEIRYKEDTGHSSLTNARASHTIGRLGNLVRENDDFFELISSKFLSESRYPISVQAASVRLLFSCAVTWMYPHVFEEPVLENIKAWVIDDHDLGRKKSADSEMLRTYSTGLLAVCLTGGGQVVEDVLTSGVPAKLMRYLRIRFLGETSTSQKDANYLADSKNSSAVRGREESRARFRQVSETSNLDAPKIIEEGSVRSDGQWMEGGEPIESLPDDDSYDADADSEDKWQCRDLHDAKTKGRFSREEDADDNVRDDSSRRRNRLPRSRGKGRVNEDNEQPLTSPGSASRTGAQGRSTKDRSLNRNIDSRRTQKSLGKNNADSVAVERDDNDDCFLECKVGSKDISDLVKKAVRAAEAEARAANAPLEAIKAAGDSAAEVVKSAASEEFKKTNDEESAVRAASKAASTVIDAGNAVEVSRRSMVKTGDSKMAESETKEEAEEFFVLDFESLAKVREKFCIQCLELLGEYVEVLGPVLHEKGVDVCLVLLQRNSRHKEASKIAMLLPDVLKLICALAAHRKFAALFVDRGGIQKLLAVPRVPQVFVGLSSCLFTIGSLQPIMERVCALPPDVVHQVIELALQLLECPQDQARKNAALFFAAAFVFRAVLDSFDAQDGLQKLLNLLQDAASVRSGGVNSGGVGPSSSASLRSDRSPPEVLTSSEKQIAYHTCVALRQYFRAHLLLLIDSLRPSKYSRSAARNIPSVRAAYKPLDISNEAMDAVFRQIQKDRKLGPTFVRSRWPAVDKFLNSNGHITMLELCQAPPVERYLHDLLQYALGVLHLVSLVPYSRKLIVNAPLSNDRVGIAVILDAANGAGFVEPEIIQPALNVLVNLVCPPPSISNKSSQGASSVNMPNQNERNGESNAVAAANSSSQTGVTSGLVGDRRISLGAGAGCAGLAAQLEQGFHQARDAVRANNGIKVLLQLLQPRLVTPPAAIDCLRALACRVLLGLARDDTIAHILTKLQVGKKLSELIRDSSSQTPGDEQGRWQAELAQVAIELIAIVTNSGRASTLAATDAATPTLRRIERAAIAAATPITYHSRELLLLVHEHLQASGLATTAAALLKEAQLTPLTCLAAPSSLPPHHQSSSNESSSALQLPWPARSSSGFLTDKSKLSGTRDDDFSFKCDSIAASSSRKRPSTLKKSSALTPDTASKSGAAADSPSVQLKTPILLPMKRKINDAKLDTTGCPSQSAKRLNTTDHSPWTPLGCVTPNSVRKTSLLADVNAFTTPTSFRTDALEDTVTPSGFFNEAPQAAAHAERITLDSLVLQYLKHQHRQCPAPITTLPPLSLLHPHGCPEPKRSLDAPSNVTARLSTREFRIMYGGIHGSRRDRQFVYSRFRPWRTCRDESGALLTCITFLGDSSRIAAGSHTGELKIFDSNNSNTLESCSSHQYPVTVVQSYYSGETQLILSSSAHDVRLWDGASVSAGPRHPFDGCKGAKFSNSGTTFAALSAEITRREILLYDIQTCNLDLKLTDTSTSSSGRGHLYSLPHFSPSDTMVLWNGVLWDRRGSGPVHRFDQFTDYGGGGFHPAGNEVIINSEVWDLRNFRLLRSVPSLDQTVITFNAGGDVIYAILRRHLEDVTSAFQTRRIKNPLFPSFRTVDAVNYSDIATVPVDRCVLDFATEPTDSFVGLVTMDDQEQMYSSARVYEIGRRRPTDDDSDPDDAETEDEEDEEDENDDLGEDPLLGPDGDGDSDGDMSIDEDDDDSAIDLDDDDDDEDEDGDFVVDDVGFGGLGGFLEIVTEGDEDDDDSQLGGSLSSGDEDFVGAF